MTDGRPPVYIDGELMTPGDRLELTPELARDAYFLERCNIARGEAEGALVCACDDDDPDGCMHFVSGYPWCRPCAEHHRPPECAINEAGEPLSPCGCTWAETFAPGYFDQPCRHEPQPIPPTLGESQ